MSAPNNTDISATIIQMASKDEFGAPLIPSGSPAFDSRTREHAYEGCCRLPSSVAKRSRGVVDPKNQGESSETTTMNFCHLIS